MTLGNFQEEREGVVPGTVTIWSGNVTDLPPGWGLCDGNNGTVDLSDRFVKSVPSDSTDPGTAGGQDNLVLSEVNLPPHSHTGSTSLDGDHIHTTGDSHTSHTGDSGDETFDYSGPSSEPTHGGGSHSHTFTAEATGALTPNPINNVPRYYNVAYIAKL